MKLVVIDILKALIKVGRPWVLNYGNIIFMFFLQFFFLEYEKCINMII